MTEKIIKGLTNAQAILKLKNEGKNIFNEKKKKTPVKLLLEQFSDIIIIMLVLGAFVSLLLGEIADSMVIMAIVVLNGVLGFVQEYKTEKSLEALKALSAPLCMVIREGKKEKILTENVVTEDIVVIAPGDKVPADCEIISEGEVTVDESVLTGESVPVRKTKGEKLYMGTGVKSGKCNARVYAIGMNTKMGKVADMLEGDENETPLKKRLNKIGKMLVGISLGVCALIAVAGLYYGHSLKTVFFSAVSLAVAAIPEGLPAAVTLCLAIGVRRMLKKNALIRKLPAVETLGCTTVICTDKTGTLTKNKMTAVKMYTADYEGDVNNSSKAPALLKMARLCLDEDISENYGDPTEKAIYNVCKNEDIKDYLRVGEIPFSSERKAMTVIHKINGEYLSVTKGAPDRILKKCRKIYADGNEVSLNSREEIENKIKEMAGEALRVIAFAYKRGSSITKADAEEGNLVFLGLIGIMDPPRKEVKDAIKKCYKAGVKTVMITGDHSVTALEIAKQIGMKTNKDGVITGEELDKISDRDLEKRVSDVSIYARVSPEHKMRVVKALKNMGNIVAMTGDGVNDAPALKEADIGIAMGCQGTEVAKESANMVLTDDNFATIVGAVEEGRIIYNNIRKFIRYLLACNLGEILLMGCAAFMGLPVPLLPIQILWVNLVTDGLPALALGMCKGEKDIMSRPPRSLRESIFAGGLGVGIIFSGLIIGCSALISFVVGYRVHGSLPAARTMCFGVLIIAEMFFALRCRSERVKTPIFENKFLIGAIIISLVLMIGVMYMPFIREVFSVISPNKKMWIEILLFSSIETVVGMILKINKAKVIKG